MWKHILGDPWFLVVWGALLSLSNAQNPFLDISGNDLLQNNNFKPENSPDSLPPLKEENEGPNFLDLFRALDAKLESIDMKVNGMGRKIARLEKMVLELSEPTPPTIIPSLRSSDSITDSNDSMLVEEEETGTRKRTEGNAKSPEMGHVIGKSTRVVSIPGWGCESELGNRPSIGRLLAPNGIGSGDLSKVKWADGNIGFYFINFRGHFNLKVVNCSSFNNRTEDILEKTTTPPLSMPLPLKFHQVHGRNMEISQNASVARRLRGFQDAIVFTNRPVQVKEKVEMKILEINPAWFGNIIVGFTSFDPKTLQGNLSDSIFGRETRGGMWATPLTNFTVELQKENATLSYHFESNGDVHLAVDGLSQGIILTDVNRKTSLWGAASIFGETVAVELVRTKEEEP